MNELKVGLLTLVTIVAVVLMSYKITSNQSGFGVYVPYKTIINDATGVFEKSAIKIAGINAGRIRKIELRNNQALITFEILKDVFIAEDSKLRVKTLGFLGDKYIDIVIGKSTKRLNEGSLIPSTESGGIENLTKDASDIMVDVKVIVKNLRESLAAKKGEDPPVKQIIDNVNDVTKSLKRIIKGNEERINEIVLNLKEITDSLNYETDDANRDSLMARVKKIGPILDDAKKVSGDLKAIVGRINKGQGTLGRLINDDEVVDQVTDTLAGVKRLVTRVNAIRAELAVFTAYDSVESNVTSLNLDLYPAPERFYRFGITTSQFGTIDEKIITEDVNGVKTTTTRTEREKDTYRFNIQLGRRINDWIFRAGLIESTGGLGVEYLWRNYDTRFVLQVFDYRKDIGPNVRIGTEVHFWNVFYGRLYFDDIVSKTNTQSVSLGAGLRFTDQDIKSLIGLFF